MFRIIITAIFCSFIFSVSTSAQIATPGQAPKPTPNPIDKKINQRPSAPPTAASGGKALPEPFMSASIEKMKTQCVRLETEAGNIELEFFPESSPETVRSFLNLSAAGAFETTTFSRVVPGFVIQGGNLTTSEKRTPELFERARRKLPDEPSLIKHERGILSMARSDEPNSATTHFFILLGEASNLDGKFAAFGHVINGMEIVEAINKMPVDGEKPSKPVHINHTPVFPCPVKPEPENK